MSIASSKKQVDLDHLFFYVVPAVWMRKAWPLLSGQKASTTIGRMELADLVVRDHEISDEEEEDAHLQKNLVLKELQRAVIVDTTPNVNAVRTVSAGHSHGRRPPVLRTGVTHGKDFFLLGPSAWYMIKHKFGYDQEIRLNCAFVEQPNLGTTLAVILHPADVAQGLVAVNQPIPPTGRFGYESLLKKTTTNRKEDVGNVSDDENENAVMVRTNNA
jgi:hypothetical protein